MGVTATIAGLFIYPLKSARGIACSRVRLGTTGFEWDRQWMLINSDGVFLSQRSHPQLARVVPSIEAGELALLAPDLPPLRLGAVPPGRRIPVRVHRDSCFGIDAGEAAAEWASQIAREPARLVRVPARSERFAARAWAGAALLGFADGFPVLVCSQSSLDDLNSRMPQSIPMDRFRPNIVLEGLPPWAEDRIDALGIGDVTLRLVKPCTRCTIPAIDQLTGSPATDPAPVLRQFRYDKALRGMTFGENAVIEAGAPGELGRGALCEVRFDSGT
ncbi:MAG TPA: MOSC N-terminal beta barrel domain-containing protein [Steroidobacteraceae bacterium]|nr:MOSC N-terminal beta barrel domain-containing protein [Steroidobacteraceae bacterium]